MEGKSHVSSGSSLWESHAFGDYVLTIALGGAFALGLMFIVMRREAQVNLQSGMSAEGLLQQHSGMGFGKAKKNLDRKLATIQDLLRQQNQGDRQLAEERFNERRQEQAASEEAARRQRELDEAQRQSELEAARQRQEEEAARRAAERDAEEARLAAEQEAQRQAELAEAEQERQAEIEAAREQEKLESREAAQRAMSELRARLEREGAQSSDVQISLMWNNYNDLDLTSSVLRASESMAATKPPPAVVNSTLMPTCEQRRVSRSRMCSGKTARPLQAATKSTSTTTRSTRSDGSKDPTKFQVIINEGGDMREYNGELTAGDPIMLVAEFNLPSPEERAAKRRELEAELRAAGMDVPETQAAFAEAEENRQAEIEAAETERLAEIEAAKEQEVIEAKEAAQRAMSELQARLEREGAQSSDVQISLMWNNYNDLDLHVVCPSGERIHGGNKTSACGGNGR